MMTRLLTPVLIAAVLIAALAAFPQQVPAQTSYQPPSLGDSSLSVLSPIEEQKLGREFMRQARQQLEFVQDPELTGYIRDLGNQILGAGVRYDFPFTFSLVNNPVLNAFAVPGGYVTIHTGLILATESESELASVVAHEITHISQRHLPRMLARAKERSLPAAAAMIAGVLLGGQMGAAAIATTSAAVAADQLSYNREFEREADAIGIRLLADAGFNPDSMVAFFGRMERETRVQVGDIPEFLRTHPLSVNRIAEAEARAAAYPNPHRPSSAEYLHARAKIRSALSGSAERATEYFRARLNADDDLSRRVAHYGLALASLRLGHSDEARRLVDDLLESDPEFPSYAIAASLVEREAGRFDAAVERLQGIAPSRPDDDALAWYLAEALLQAGRADDARQLLRAHVRDGTDEPLLHQSLARAYGQLGDTAEGLQAEAEYHAAIGEPARALEHLRNARRHAGGSFYLSASIDARIDEIEEQMRLLGEDEPKARQ
jgi:predicted Zn-dependent protease